MINKANFTLFKAEALEKKDKGTTSLSEEVNDSTLINIASSMNNNNELSMESAAGINDAVVPDISLDVDTILPSC